MNKRKLSLFRAAGCWADSAYSSSWFYSHNGSQRGPLKHRAPAIGEKMDIACVSRLPCLFQCFFQRLLVGNFHVSCSGKPSGSDYGPRVAQSQGYFTLIGDFGSYHTVQLPQRPCALGIAPGRATAHGQRTLGARKAQLQDRPPLGQSSDAARREDRSGKLWKSAPSLDRSVPQCVS